MVATTLSFATSVNVTPISGASGIGRDWIISSRPIIASKICGSRSRVFENHGAAVTIARSMVFQNARILAKGFSDEPQRSLRAGGRADRRHRRARLQGLQG